MTGKTVKQLVGWSRLWNSSLRNLHLSEDFVYLASLHSDLRLFLFLI